MIVVLSQPFVDLLDVHVFREPKLPVSVVVASVAQRLAFANNFELDHRCPSR